VFGQIIKNIPAFSKNFSINTINKLALKMKEKTFLPGERIYFNNVENPILF